MITLDEMDQYKPFGEKAIRRGSATKPNGFAPIQFAAASPKKFSACCILQDVLSKILDALQFAEASRKKFWPKCTLQHVLSKVLGLLQNAAASYKKFWTRCNLQRHYHKNCGCNAPCSTLPQNGLVVQLREVNTFRLG